MTELRKQTIQSQPGAACEVLDPSIAASAATPTKDNYG